jgi:hypothetical protein
MSLLLQLRIVVAEADDQLDLVHRHRVGGHPLAQRALQAGDVGDLAVGRRQQVGRQRLQAAHEDVTVTVDETGQERASLEIDDVGIPAPMAHNRVLAADCDDESVFDRDRLGAHRGVIHGQDLAAGPDAVGIFRVSG